MCPTGAGALADYESAEKLFTDMGARPNRARVLRDWGRRLTDIGETSGAAKSDEALKLFEELGLRREADELRAELTGSAVA